MSYQTELAPLSNREVARNIRLARRGLFGKYNTRGYVWLNFGQTSTPNFWVKDVMNLPEGVQLHRGNFRSHTVMSFRHGVNGELVRVPAHDWRRVTSVVPVIKTDSGFCLSREQINAGVEDILADNKGLSDPEIANLLPPHTRGVFVELPSETKLTALELVTFPAYRFVPPKARYYSGGVSIHDAVVTGEDSAGIFQLVPRRVRFFDLDTR